MVLDLLFLFIRLAKMLGANSATFYIFAILSKQQKNIPDFPIVQVRLAQNEIEQLLINVEYSLPTIYEFENNLNQNIIE